MCSSKMFVARGFFVGSSGDMLIDDTDFFFLRFGEIRCNDEVTLLNNNNLFPDILKKCFISLGLCSKASCPTL